MRPPAPAIATRTAAHLMTGCGAAGGKPSCGAATGGGEACRFMGGGSGGLASPSQLASLSFSKKTDRRLGLWATFFPALHVAEVVVPPVLVERIDQQRRAEEVADLGLGHPVLELRDQVLGHVVALLDVDRIARRPHPERTSASSIGARRRMDFRRKA